MAWPPSGRVTLIPEADMTRSTLFDRLNQELEAFGKKAQAALDEGKLQIELLRLRRRRDNAARDLGLLMYRRERGRESEPRRIDALMSRIDDLEAEIARLEQQISEGRRSGPRSNQPAPATLGADKTEEAGTP
jgi:outer membrane murein-binding lipoprotein Lpp